MAVRKRGILLVEDDPVQGLVYQSALSRLSSEISITNNVEDAVRIFARSSLSLCIVDLGIYLAGNTYDK